MFKNYNKIPATSFRIDPELVEEFKFMAKKRGYTYQEAISESIKAWINRTDILEKNPE